MSRRRRSKQVEDVPPPAVSFWRAPPASTGSIFLFWIVAALNFYQRPAWLEIFDNIKSWPNLLPPVHRMSLAALGSHLALLGMLAVVCASACLLGRALLRRAGAAISPAAAEMTLGGAAAAGVFGTVMLILGLLGLWERALLGVLLIASAAGAGVLWYKDKGIGTGVAGGSWRLWESAALAAIAVFMGTNLLLAFAPETFYDALVYHLALPDLYLRRGGITATPENLYSGFPLLTSMIFAGVMPFGGDVLARLINWAMGLGTVVLTYALCRRFSTRSAACTAALLFASIPLFGFMASQTGADTGWALFELSALYFLSQRLSPAEGPRRESVFAGAMMGLAMSCKYQAWPVMLLLAALFFSALPGARRERMREAGLFIGAALLAVLPWIIKDLVLYGNPIYPFYHELFSQGPLPDWRQLVADAQRRDLALLLTSWNGFEGMKAFLLHPWSLSMELADPGLILLLLLPFLFLCRFEGPRRFLWLALLGSWLLWSLSSRLVRYLVPHLPAACVLFAWALEEVFSPKVRGYLRAALLGLVGLNFVLLALHFKVLDAHPVVMGRQSRAEYLRSSHPVYHYPYYPAVEFINESTPEDAKVLFLGEARGYYCLRDHVNTTVYDEYPLEYWIKKSESPSGLRRIFADEGITHILVNRMELSRWQEGDKRFLPLGPSKLKLWQDFMMTYLKRVFEDKGPAGGGTPTRWSVVYELKPA